jgi:hypothetical protein
MRRLLVLLLALVFAVGGMMAVYAGDQPPGPAPNSHDGIPDGSGWDVPPGPFGPSEPAGPTLSG